MGKLKRTICIILAALTIISAPLTSYMEARAGELALELSLFDQLLIMFGINAGLGDQYDYFKRQSELKELFEAAAEGGTAELSGYGTVNFSETESLQEWFEWSLDCQKFLLGNLSVVNPENAARYMEAGKALDEVSYKNSGTCATNALNDNISTFYDDYNGSSEALAEDIRSCFTVINGGGIFNDDNDDDEEKAARREKFWKTFFAVAAAGMLGVGNAAVPYAAMKMYGDSEFNEYDAVFGDASFDGNYAMNADGQYSINFNCTNSDDTSYANYEIWKGEITFFDFPVVGVINNSLNYVYFYRLGSGKLNSVHLKYTSYKEGRNPISATVFGCPYYNFSCNFPLYTSEGSALNALMANKYSDAENIQKSYADFKSNTGTAGAVIGNPLSGYVGSLKSLANLIDIIPEVREASDTYGGTAEMLPEIARILSEAGDIAVGNPDADDPNSSSNYSGILAKILAAINRLPAAILSALAGKFMTAERLETLINGIPVILAGVLSDAFSNSQISILPGILSDALSAVFPDAASAIKALTDLPAVIISAVSGIQVKVPDIVIPDIVIPEIAIPDIVIPDIVIPDIAVPDVFVESPAITLNPSYDVTVANDFTGLEGIISKAVQGVLTNVFVPNKVATLEKIGEMQEYFEFKDDVVTAVDDLKTMLFGITPSPVLKIPIGKTTSKKYNYGTGNYIIIDVSWYAPYKQFGDKVILAIAWALFLWRLFLKLPGIISGTEGSIMAADRSYQKYSSGKD